MLEVSVYSMFDIPVELLKTVRIVRLRIWNMEQMAWWDRYNSRLLMEERSDIIYELEDQRVRVLGS